MSAAPAFSAEDAVAAQRALRDALGLPPELFPLPAFIGMISDEIETWRASGRSDGELAALVSRVTGKGLLADDVARHYASTAMREAARKKGDR